MPGRSRRGGNTYVHLEPELRARLDDAIEELNTRTAAVAHPLLATATRGRVLRCALEEWLARFAAQEKPYPVPPRRARRRLR